MPKLTDLEVQKIKPDGKDRMISDEAGRGEGRLALRITPTGSKVWYFRYTASDGRREKVRIGDYPSMSLREARAQAAELSIRRQRGDADLKATLTHEQEQRDTERRRARAEAEAAEARARAGSLQTLMDLYIGHLEASGKTSAKDVACLFSNHVSEAFPALATSQAAAVSAQEFREVLARLTDAGKGRTAGKLRSYLKAAFALAMRAEFDPTAPAGFIDLHIEHNPLERLPALSQFNRARERALSWPELHAYLDNLQAMPDGATKDLLLLALILGGQRPEQLSRLKQEHIDLNDRTLTIFDAKGKRTQARAHTLSLSDLGVEIVTRRMEYAKGGWLFSSTHGRVKLRPETLTVAAGHICQTMMEAGAARSVFQLRDIRRTAETLLAGMGVSKDLRAQIQSHGLSGVQQRHYDKHDYLSEKRRVLEAWETKLFKREAGANVVRLAKAA